jgi:phosphomannomutase
MARTPARGLQLPAVRFGTSGWRGVLGEDFHLPGARALVRALALWAGAPEARPRILVAHDTRFQGERLAAEAAGVLLEAGARPVCCAGATPTPVAAATVRRRRLAAGLVFTASHNAASYQGLKVVAPWGGSAPPAITDRLAHEANRLLALGGVPVPASLSKAPRTTDPRGPYLRALLARLDRSALASAGITVVYDAMHGAGAQVARQAFEELGVRTHCLRGEPDPNFGGSAPEPSAALLGALTTRLSRARGRWLGIATDGDADRFAAVDVGGSLLGEADALALLVDHMARSGRVRRGLALSVASGSLPERVARAHGLAVQRLPIGFKHLSEALVEGTAELAGDESGGFAWAPLARDKDGILAGCLLAELVATSAAPLGARLAELRAEHGAAFWGRTGIANPAAHRRSLERLSLAPPARFDGRRVLRAEAREGLRLDLEGGGFVLWRDSGTEPLLRVYAEAPSAAGLRRRLAAAVSRISR